MCCSRNFCVAIAVVLVAVHIPAIHSVWGAFSIIPNQMCCSRSFCVAIAVVLLAVNIPAIHSVWGAFVWEPQYHYRSHFFQEPPSSGEQDVFAIVMVFPVRDAHPLDARSTRQAVYHVLKGANLLTKAAHKFSSSATTTTGNNNATEKSDVLTVQFSAQRQPGLSEPDMVVEGFVVDVEIEGEADTMASQIQQNLSKAGQLPKGFRIRAVNLGAASPGIIYATLPPNHATIHNLFLVLYCFKAERNIDNVLAQHGYHGANWTAILVPVTEQDQHGQPFQKHLIWFIYNGCQILL